MTNVNTLPPATTADLFANTTTIDVRSQFVGEQIDLTPLRQPAIGRAPLMIPVGTSGCAVLFAYGAVVTFGLSPAEATDFQQALTPHIVGAFSAPETERVQLTALAAAPPPDHSAPVAAHQTDHQTDHQIDYRLDDPQLAVADFRQERLQLLADVLAKSVVLAHYEQRTARAFDQIEPFARSLQLAALGKRESQAMLKQLGDTLTIEHKIVGRVEIVDKPAVLWENPELEAFYLHLEAEYEIRDRHLALERKLNLVARTAETAIGLLHHQASHRVEWYIVILIVMEILLSIVFAVF